MSVASNLLRSPRKGAAASGDKAVMPSRQKPLAVGKSSVLRRSS